MKLADYVARLTEELAHTTFGSNALLLGVITEAAWRAGGCTCSRRGAPLDDGNPIYAADVTCPIHPIHCRTDGILDHEPPTVLIDGEPRCDFCRLVITERRPDLEVKPIPAMERPALTDRQEKAPDPKQEDAVTWESLTEGRVIRYQHVSRARRLSGKPLVVRRGRIDKVYPPGPRRQGQINLTVLTKDGKPHAGLRRTYLHELEFIVGLEPVSTPAAG